MDLMTLLGLLLGIGSTYYVMSQGKIAYLLFNPDAAILVIGGTIGATLITFPWKVIRQVPRAIWLVFFPPKKDQPSMVIRNIVQLAERAKTKGIPSLISDVKGKGNNHFLVEGIQMLVDDLDPEIIRENMEKDITFIRRRHQQIAGIFRTMGTYAPIFGLLGTLIGVVQVLRNLTDPQSMGASMAIAVTTTFYGIFLTNFVFLPIAGKLTVHSDDELLLKEVIIEGLLSIQKGDIPIIVSKKLETFLSYKIRKKEIKKKKK
ncbi:MAG: motility protein A [Elusimicrobia bacterium]|nr:motility protein A [Elusimicrobiota bacterium]MBD3411946.1 motility protein A [Elusimicrobiota bacterium]